KSASAVARGLRMVPASVTPVRLSSRAASTMPEYSRPMNSMRPWAARRSSLRRRSVLMCVFIREALSLRKYWESRPTRCAGAHLSGEHVPHHAVGHGHNILGLDADALHDRAAGANILVYCSPPCGVVYAGGGAGRKQHCRAHCQRADSFHKLLHEAVTSNIT